MLLHRLLINNRHGQPKCLPRTSQEQLYCLYYERCVVAHRGR